MLIFHFPNQGHQSDVGPELLGMFLFLVELAALEAAQPSLNFYLTNYSVLLISSASVHLIPDLSILSQIIEVPIPSQPH